jgi:DNA-binding transcriptional MocR family regulator
VVNDSVPVSIGSRRISDIPFNLAYRQLHRREHHAAAAQTTEVIDPALRERLTIAKMNIVISGSPLDETLTAAILDNREKILSVRRSLLATGLSKVATWVGNQKGLVDWVKPDGGALCCLRLNPDAFDAAGVARFWSALPELELQIGDGAWFGECSAVLRLGFGYLQTALQAGLTVPGPDFA